mgnify:FL=1
MNTIEFKANQEQPHSGKGITLGVLTHRTGDIPCAKLDDNCKWMRKVQKVATRYNRAFNVCEIKNSDVSRNAFGMLPGRKYYD